MSRRMACETARRVVERPRARALSTSAALALAMPAQTPSSSSRAAKARKKAVTAASLTWPICWKAA